MSDPRPALGRAIRSARLKLGISQEELAHRAGLDRSYMGQVERGQVNISILSLARIAEAVGVRLRQLVKDM